MLLALPVSVQAEDFAYTTNANNTIAMTGYTGPGGNVTILCTIFVARTHSLRNEIGRLSAVRDQQITQLASIQSALRRPSAASQRRNGLKQAHATLVSFRPLNAGGDIAARCPCQRKTLHRPFSCKAAGSIGD